MIDYISFFEKQLERVNYWLSYAETKNAAISTSDNVRSCLVNCPCWIEFV